MQFGGGLFIELKINASFLFFVLGSLYMNLYSFFQDFNPSKFLVHVFLSLFSISFALKLDGTITASYWLVFAPLWIWKAISIIGCVLGCVAWTQSVSMASAAGHSLSRELVVQFRAMLLSTSLNLLLLAFEILLCYNLEATPQNKVLWVVVISPLIILSITCIGIGIWAIRNGRSFDFEIFCSVNVLEFIFIALKLDGFIDWSWIIVFIPLWSVMAMFGIAIIYLLLLICILSRSMDTPSQRYQHQLCMAFGHLALMPPLLIFEICIALKLDDRMDISYTSAVVPLIMAFFILILMSFRSRGWNICKFLFPNFIFFFFKFQLIF